VKNMNEKERKEKIEKEIGVEYSMNENNEQYWGNDKQD